MGGSLIKLPANGVVGGGFDEGKERGITTRKEKGKLAGERSVPGRKIEGTPKNFGTMDGLNGQ